MSKQIMEVVFVICSIVLLGSYHLRLLRKMRISPNTTFMGRHRLLRNSWLKLDKNGRELVIVQTMRNLIMSANFMASTAILLAAGFLGGAFTTGSEIFSQFVNSLNFFGIESQQLLLFKVLILVLNFFIAFFNFSLAFRSFGYIGMMSSLPDDNKEHDLAKELEKGSLHYALGMRGFYLSIPLMLWLFGPVWMFFGSIVLVLVLRKVD
jgi:uncharacterized membrane protein